MRGGRGQTGAAARSGVQGTGAGAVVFTLAWAPSTSPARQVAFIGSLLAVAAGVITATVAWACEPAESDGGGAAG